MDDYNLSAISEAKNEYSARLVNILSPLVIQGIKSIFKEALELCISNDETEKYLMTCQNCLTRVPKWSQTIIEVETERIINTSRCSYLEDLITCVHIAQLKVLTSIRVSNKQKKIDIDIPKVQDFIHKVYIRFARKLYANVYLFEKDIKPLQIQKNNREAELICKECILNVIRESIPVDKILRAYIDETVEEELVNETVIQEEDVKPEETVNSEESENNQQENSDTKEKQEMQVSSNNSVNDSNDSGNSTQESSGVIKKINNTLSSSDNDITTNVSQNQEDIIEDIDDHKEDLTTSNVNNIKINTEKASVSEESGKIKFNNTDSVKSYSPSENVIETSERPINNILAPKTIKRLEEISVQRNLEDKLAAEEDDDDDEEEEKIQILAESPSIELDVLDVESL